VVRTKRSEVSGRSIMDCGCDCVRYAAHVYKIAAHVPGIACGAMCSHLLMGANRVVCSVLVIARLVCAIISIMFYMRGLLNVFSLLCNIKISIMITQIRSAYYMKHHCASS
jgi:hypothetical protein